MMTKSKDTDISFQHYLVIFLDVLGQREILREIKSLPTNNQEQETFIRKIQETLGRVIKVRDAFRMFFEGSKSYVPNTDLVPSELRKEFISSQKSNAYFYGFSDTIIIAVPLMSNGDENCTAVNGVFLALFATCGMGISALADGIVLRAGLDVGVAAEIQDKEIYGPALERAYYLESQMAEYPRFIVGDELIKYLLWVEGQECKTRYGKVAKGVAKFCREMIVRDTDGRLMIDFLGKRFKESDDNPIDINIVTSVRDFVKSQYNKYLDKDNQKLASRYYRLMRYIESRQELWGIE